MNIQPFFNRFLSLPEHLQAQVMDYADFLSVRHQNGHEEHFEEIDENEPLTPEMEAFLDERLEKMKKHPGKRRLSDDFIKELRKERGYEV